LVGLLCIGEANVTKFWFGDVVQLVFIEHWGFLTIEEITICSTHFCDSTRQLFKEKQQQHRI